MRKRDIDRFFKELDRELNQPCEVILTGAAAGSLMGNIRPSLDIDFELRRSGRGRAAVAAKIDEAVSQASGKVGLAANYSADIGRWSMISFLDYRRKAMPYRTFGKLSVRLMAPEYWTIGKMARYLRPDISDMVEVIRKKGLKCGTLASLWAKALKKSPLSLSSGQFRDHVVDFLSSYGKKLWGIAACEAAVQRFKKIAGIR